MDEFHLNCEPIAVDDDGYTVSFDAKLLFPPHAQAEDQEKEKEQQKLLEFFEMNGFAVLRNIFNESECAATRDAMWTILEKESLDKPKQKKNQILSPAEAPVPVPVAAGGKIWSKAAMKRERKKATESSSEHKEQKEQKQQQQKQQLEQQQQQQQHYNQQPHQQQLAADQTHQQQQQVQKQQPQHQEEQQQQQQPELQQQQQQQQTQPPPQLKFNRSDPRTWHLLGAAGKYGLSTRGPCFDSALVRNRQHPLLLQSLAMLLALPDRRDVMVSHDRFTVYRATQFNLSDSSNDINGAQFATGRRNVHLDLNPWWWETDAYATVLPGLHTLQYKDPQGTQPSVRMCDDADRSRSDRRPPSIAKRSLFSQQSGSKAIVGRFQIDFSIIARRLHIDSIDYKAIAK
jgi:chemotaxis protein histidine kinase CheA